MTPTSRVTLFVMASSRQHQPRPSGSTARPGLSIRHDEDDHAVDPPFVPEGTTQPEVVFSFFSRRRIRKTSEAAHGIVVERLRQAQRQGGAASPSGLAREIRSVHLTIKAARTAHGPARDVIQERLRNGYLQVAASALILAERATRPEEPDRGSKSPNDPRRSSTDKGEPYRPPNFAVPKS